MWVPIKYPFVVSGPRLGDYFLDPSEGLGKGPKQTILKPNKPGMSL